MRNKSGVFAVTSYMQHRMTLLCQVNGTNVESESHEGAVTLVRQSGDTLSLQVINSVRETTDETFIPWSCHVSKFRLGTEAVA